MTPVDQAKREIAPVWAEYQQVRPVCLRFGKTCYEWQQKLKTTELAEVWKDLKIEEIVAVREMDAYLESEGVERLHIEKRTSREEPDSFEEIRKVALTLIKLGYQALQKTDIKPSLLDSATVWARGKLKEKDHEQTSIVR